MDESQKDGHGTEIIKNKLPNNLSVQLASTMTATPSSEIMTDFLQAQFSINTANKSKEGTSLKNLRD